MNRILLENPIENIYERERERESSIVIVKHSNNNLINQIYDDILSNFKELEEFYTKLSIEDYREILKKTQDLLNRKNYTERICEACEPEIKSYLNEDKFMVQSNLYLRATRPNVQKEDESIGWHRETFYGSNMEKSVNLWTPISGVNNLNTLQFIPNSQNTPESEIITTQINSKITTKESTGNKVGFLYAPKIITSGVDFSKKTPMNVPYFHSALFSGLLIHGAANNFSQNIRFSVDFRILPHSVYNKEISKQSHDASNKPYFIPY